MSPTDDLIPILKKLRMSGVLQTLDLRTKQAVDDNLPYEEFLLRLLSDEVERREAKRLQLRLNRADFEHAKTLNDFNFSFNEEIPKARIIDLATCTFIPRHDNILLVGQAGVGKSHVAQAIGHRACLRQRYERGSLIFTSNRDIQEWYPLFGDALLASTAMDRLLHHAHVIEMEGDSYRNPKLPHRASAKGENTHAAT